MIVLNESDTITSIQITHSPEWGILVGLVFFSVGKKELARIGDIDAKSFGTNEPYPKTIVELSKDEILVGISTSALFPAYPGRLPHFQFLIARLD